MTDTTPGAAPARPREITGTTPVHRLAAALTDLEPLLGAVTEPLRVAPPPGLAPGARSAFLATVDALTAELGVPRLTPAAPDDELWSVELAVSAHLSRALETASPVAALGADPEAADPEAAGRAVAVARAGPPGRPVALRSHDGAPLRGYQAGAPDLPAVVVVPAVGMPVGLAAPWLRALAGVRHVVTWESRGMFAGADAPGLFPMNRYDLAAQAADVVAVLDGFGIEEAHVMGLCGGAAIALAAAAASPRVASLSLWHGDYELGGDAAKTPHQRDVQNLLAMAGRSPRNALGLHRMMRRPQALDALRADIAHHLLHPYASAALMHRYGQLNGEIMTTDCRPLLEEVRQPTLVVSSDQDTTAHPEGSVHVARHLSCSTLRMMPHGNHLTAFDAAPALVRVLTDFTRAPATPTRHAREGA
ncbi:alpha/beta fold hydrolase [Streptomyces sp. NPDC007100]|uniref:alpha/beta fold hydrolase n=1 Tax=Streptomyces sp. NPDC007100 TaxID=3155602 RepID=UPI00340BFE78